MNSKFGREYEKDPEGFMERNVPEEVMKAFEPLDQIYRKATSEFSSTFGPARSIIMVDERVYKLF